MFFNIMWLIIYDTKIYFSFELALSHALRVWDEVFLGLVILFYSRGVNVRPNPRTRHEPDTDFFGLGLGLNGFGS